MMEHIAIPAIVREGFAISVESSDPLCLKLSDNADVEMLPLLGPYLHQVHANLCRVGACAMQVDLRQLYFMNSSCFKSVITWIASIKALEQEQRYAVTFLTSSRLNWQKRTLRSILDFAPTIVSVQES